MIIGIPFSKGGLGKTEGTDKAPSSIIKHLQDGIDEFGRFSGAECKILPLDQSNISGALDTIKNAVSRMPDGTVMIGGDHTITHATLAGFAEKHDDFGYIVFDAHLDMMQPFSVPTHENYLRQAIHDGIVDKSKVIVIGHRVWDKEERDYVKREHIIHYPMHEIMKEGIHRTCDAIMAAARDWKHIYLSIDIDVLDPAFAPGTGYAEPGGMSTRELLYMIHRLTLLPNIRMADVVEVNPNTDVNERTSIAAAKLAFELHSSLNRNKNS